MQNRIFLTMFTIMLLSGCSGQHSFMTSADVNDPQVIGGDKIDFENPIANSTVALMDEQDGELCSGVMISNELILTAAHCVYSGMTSLLVYFTPNIKDGDSYNSRYAVTCIQHENYKSDVDKMDTADIALVRVSGTLPYGYKPVPLYPDSDKLRAADDIIVAGYGVNRSWGKTAGAGILRTTTLKVREPRSGKTEMVLNQSFKKGVCNGDSGGPAFIKKGGQLYLVGIASRGGSYDFPGAPKCSVTSTYTRVDAYLGWIKKTSAQLMAE
ncbi:MAG: S1 family peptidase [Bacillota bacterium]